MKKIFALILTAAMLAALSITTFAQGRSRSRNYDSRNCDSRNYDSRSYDSRNYDSRSYDSRIYNSQGYYNQQGYYDNSNVYYDYGRQNGGQRIWDQHRDKLTVGAGTVGGAILGSLLGGRRGAAIGALAGAGGSALYTYKVRKNRYRY